MRMSDPDYHFLVNNGPEARIRHNGETGPAQPLLYK
jgi:hypothetical protein